MSRIHGKTFVTPALGRWIQEHLWGWLADLPVQLTW